MKHLIILLTLTVLLFSLPVLSWGQHRAPDFDGCGHGMQDGWGHGKQDCQGYGRSGKGGHKAGMLLHMADKIGLNDEQKGKIKSMMEEFGLEKIDMKAELEKAKLKLKHLRHNDASENEVLAMMDKVGQLRTEMQKMKYRHHQAVKSVLNDEQLEKLKELKKAKQHKGMGSFGGRFDGDHDEKQFDEHGGKGPFGHGGHGQ